MRDRIANKATMDHPCEEQMDRFSDGRFPRFMVADEEIDAWLERQAEPPPVALEILDDERAVTSVTRSDAALANEIVTEVH